MYVPNWIDLDGVVNMRDLGGMVTAGGEIVQPHRMLRSDNLQDLTPASVRTLVQDFGLRDVVDLRTHVEVAKEGDVRRAKLYYLRGTSGKASKVKGRVVARSKKERSPKSFDQQETDTANAENDRVTSEEEANRTE